MAGKIKVPSELVPSQSNKIMLRSKYIYDDVKGHTQEEINAALEEQIESKVIEAGGVNWDTVPTAGSNNAVKSKDIKAALEKVTGYFVLDSNVLESTVDKTVTVADFPALAIGGSIKIKMLTKNTATNPTLRIGPANATAYPLYYNEERASASNSWEANEVISVYYDGSVYQASNAQGGGAGDGAFNISKYNAIEGVYATFRTFAEALGTNGVNVPGSKRKGGMTVKYIQLTDGTYSIIKTEGIETEPSGTEVQEAIDIADGTYIASELTDIETLPANAGDKITYYLTVTEEIEVEAETEGDEPTTETVTTYTTWVVTKLTNDITEYVQWMLKSTQWSIDEKDWVGIDTELGEDKKGTPATKTVSEYAQLREDVIAAALCDLHKNLTVLPDDIMRYNTRKKKILVFGASIEADARTSTWGVGDPKGWLYWLNQAPYVDEIYNFANGSSYLTGVTSSTYDANYRVANHTINIYWNQIIHALRMYLSGNIEAPDVVLITQGGNDIQWTTNRNQTSIFAATADEVFSTNINDFNFTGFSSNENVIAGNFTEAEINNMRANMLTIANSVRYISEIIYTYWPETQIVWMGEMYTRGGDITRTNIENRFNELGNKIESCCIKMGIPFLRADKESGRWNIYEMKKHIAAGGSADDDYQAGKNHSWGFTRDGYHTTIKGAELFGRYMINKLASVLRY